MISRFLPLRTPNSCGAEAEQAEEAAESACNWCLDAGTVLGKTEPIKLVLVGLPNAGKSTLLNRLLGFERALTGPEPALTRDAVMADLQWRGWRFEVTDTAGWLKRATLKNYDQSGGRVAGMTVTQVSILPPLCSGEDVARLTSECAPVPVVDFRQTAWLRP